MDPRAQNGDKFQKTATHATAAVATQDAAAGKKHHITKIAVSSDKAGALVLVKDGTTVIWQLQIGASKHEEAFEQPLEGTTGNLVSVEIDGTSACKANMTGFTLTK